MIGLVRAAMKNSEAAVALTAMTVDSTAGRLDGQWAVMYRLRRLHRRS